MNNAPVLNHIITFANVQNIDTYLKRYRKAGFLVSKQTVRHKPGRRNGFIYFGPEYIEFEWVENKKEFNQKGWGVQKFFSCNPRPYGLAFESNNVEVLHKNLKKKGFALKSIWTKAPADGDPRDPWWSFQDIPQKYLSGAWIFVLTYLKRDYSKPRRISVPKNSIYALSGVTLVSNNPQLRLHQWQKFLGQARIRDPHTFEWMSPQTYSKKYGIKRVALEKFSAYQEIGLIHLLADNLRKAEKMLRKNNFAIKKYKDGFFILPDKRDGFTFLVREQKTSIWLKHRAAFGQRFLVKKK